MHLLEADPSGISKLMFIGTLGMLTLAVGIIVFVIFHQRKVIRYQMEMKKMENENNALFSATMVLTAYVDEKGNVKYVKSDWDSLFNEDKEEKEND